MRNYRRMLHYNKFKMKVKEFCKRLGHGNILPYGNLYRWCGDSNTFREYQDADITAYYQGKIGGCVLFKGKRKFFCFIILNDRVNFGGYNYQLQRISEEHFLDMFSDEVKVLDKENFEKIKIKYAESKI